MNDRPRLRALDGLLLLALAAAGASATLAAVAAKQGRGASAPAAATAPSAVESADSGRRETAYLAGGCFWGMEEVLRKLPGVVDTEVGYMGGPIPNPAPADVESGTTGHAETVRIVFDPARLSYGQLLELFFRLHDPTTKNRQGRDAGSQYRSAIFFVSGDQKRVAGEIRDKVEKSGKWQRPLTTEITRAGVFWPAPEAQQDYLRKHPDGYTCHYLRDFTFD